MVVIGEAGFRGLLILHAVACNCIHRVVGGVPDHLQFVVRATIGIRRHHRRRGDFARKLLHVRDGDRHGPHDAGAAAVLNRHRYLVDIVVISSSATRILEVQRGLGDELPGRCVDVERRRVRASEAVGQGVAELDIVVVFPVVVVVGGRDGVADVDAGRRVFGHLSRDGIASVFEHWIDRMYHAVGGEQNSHEQCKGEREGRGHGGDG